MAPKLRTSSSLENVDDSKTLWHGRESAAQNVRRYSMSSEECQKGAGQGTLMGVVFPCMANILGVLLFLRLPWIVGKAGVLQGFLLVFVCCCCTFVTTLSLAAVATNGKIVGGGAYFLISRSLGPALGAGVGLCFYMANSIGAAMYFMGTVEAWEMAQPDSQILPAGDINNIRVTGFCILLVALVIVGGGIKYVARLGTVFLFIVLFVILCMYLGCFFGPGDDKQYDVDLTDPPDGVPATITLQWSGPSSKYFGDNFGAAYDSTQYAFTGDTTEHGFISLMALWFPAVTGIMAGSNRSSDLKDPAASIPTGTLFAQGVTSIMYLSFVLLYGAVAPRESLLHDKFFAAIASWPAKELVVYGVMASTIGAGLTSLVSGCRLLSAIAGDGTLPILKVFAVRPGQEPRLALLASGVLCACAVAIGQLNAVAPVLTMFFLMCYTCVNMSCAILHAVSDPNWRPRFRYYHWSISLAGAILCVWMMFAISPLFAMIAIVFCSTIFTYASHNSHQVKWGDGFQGMKFQIARNILTHMDITAHTKNWRPQLLVITQATIAERDSGEQDDCIELKEPELLCLASQLKGGRGITIFGGVCTTEGKDIFSDGGQFMSVQQRDKVLDGQHAMSRLLHKWHIEGFGRVVHTEDFSNGLMSLVQLSGLGAFQPNCVLACWPKEAEWRLKTSKGAECRAQLIRMIQVAVVFQKVMLLAKGAPFPPLNERLNGNVDIWWIVADGGILLLLPFLLGKHPVWSRCHTRLFAVADNNMDDPEQVKAELQAYVKDFRLNIEVHVKVIDPMLDEEMRAIVEDERGEGVDAPVRDDELPARQMSTSSKISAGSGIAQWRRSESSGEHKGKNFPAAPPTSIGRQVSGQPAGLDAVIFDPARQISKQSGRGKDYSIPAYNSKGMDPSSAKSNAFEARDVLFMQRADQLSSYAACSTSELVLAKGMNKMIAQESGESELVVTNLPDMPPGESAYGYFELVEEMTKNVKRVFLVRGTTTEVITAFT